MYVYTFESNQLGKPPFKKENLSGLNCSLLRHPCRYKVTLKIPTLSTACQTVVKNNCSNVFDTLFINKSVVNLATRALVTYSSTVWCSSDEVR